MLKIRPVTHLTGLGGQEGPEVMAETATSESELFIQLDTAGLAALLKAVEAAMVEGQGHLTLRSGGGLIARSGGSSNRFAGVTVIFADSAGPPDDAWRTQSPDPEPEPIAPVLALLQD